jgi:trehalose/maltose hydrolase-like predicted phosphorylase
VSSHSHYHYHYHINLDVFSLSFNFQLCRTFLDVLVGTCCAPDTSVMGPDEFHSLTDDNAYTNAAAATALKFAADAAEVLGETPPGLAQWRVVSSQMFIPFDAEGQFHPEYMALYQGHGQSSNATGPYAPPTIVKQADAILMGYPLGWNMTDNVRKNDLDVYNKYTTGNGPAM